MYNFKMEPDSSEHRYAIVKSVPRGSGTPARMTQPNREQVSAIFGGHRREGGTKRIQKLVSGARQPAPDQGPTILRQAVLADTGSRPVRRARGAGGLASAMSTDAESC